MTILQRFAKLNTREFEKNLHSRNFVPAKLNTFKVFQSCLTMMSTLGMTPYLNDAKKNYPTYVCFFIFVH